MLDKLTQCVLNKINADSDGSYKVMETEDFISAMPAKSCADETGVANAIRYLYERGYVDLKYAESGTFCVCSLPKGRQYAETARLPENGSVYRKRTLFAIAFSGGLFGSLLGGVIVGIIFTLLI